MLQWNPHRQTKLQHHFHSLNECMNLDKIKPRKHKPCNPLAPNLLSVQRASVKNVPFSWSCQVPCFVTEPPWCDGTWRLRLCQPHSFLFSIHTRPCPDYLLRFFFFFFVAHGFISFSKERTDGKQGPECICWTLSWLRSLLPLAFSQQWWCCLCQSLVSVWLPWEDCCLDEVGIDVQELLKFSLVTCF